MHPNRKRQQTKFNCSVNIHQFNSGDRETANVKRRMSSFQRRKSLSAGMNIITYNGDRFLECA